MYKIDEHIAEGGVVICEHPFKEELEDEIGGLKKYREYKYSKGKFGVFNKAIRTP